MTQAVTKILDKMERRVTSICGISQYNESFVDFLIVLISISILSVRWIITNLAGLTVRLIRKKRNEGNGFFNIHEINSNVIVELITIWQSTYNYYSPTIYAKDQTKVAEIIEVGSVPIDTSTIPYSMTAKELHTKISSFEKVTYITVFALLAIFLGILPLVLAVIPSNQKETKADAFFENNIVLKELIKSNAKPIGLYFDGVTHDRSWIKESYSKNSSVFSDLSITLNDTPFTRNFPIEMEIFNNCQSLISGTDLTNEVLNPKDKQADELAERFFSSNVLKAIVQHATEYNDDSFYGDALYHFFAGLLFES
ncbi:1982_t:CDS:2, partial [Funneliformis geosporum]